MRQLKRQTDRYRKTKAQKQRQKGQNERHGYRDRAKGIERLGDRQTERTRQERE